MTTGLELPGGKVIFERTLSNIRIFSGLTSESRRVIEGRCSWQFHTAGSEIIGCGTSTDDVVFVVDGRVRVVNYSSTGRVISFAEIERGGLVGELAAIDRQPRSASVVALTDCVVARLSAQLFMRSVSEHSVVALGVIRHLAATVRAASSRIMELSTETAPQRICAELLRLGQMNRQPDGSYVLQPAPHHKDIASRVSTTRETVARVMGDLSRSGIVQRSRGALVIREIERLSRLVDEVGTEKGVHLNVGAAQARTGGDP